MSLSVQKKLVTEQPKMTVSRIRFIVRWCLLLVLTKNTGKTSASPCEDYKLRPAADFSNKIRQLVSDAKEVSMQSCIVNDGAECFPMQFNDVSGNTEYQTLKQYLEKIGVDLVNLNLDGFPSRNSNPPSKLNDMFLQRIDALELDLKDFFCKSGQCALNDSSSRSFRCTTGPSVVADSPIQLRNYQEKVILLNKDIKSYLKIEKICHETTGQSRKQIFYYSKDYDPGVGELQRTKDGPVEKVKLCLVNAGATCFPDSEAEAKIFEKYYGPKDGGVIQEDPEDKLEERARGNINIQKYPGRRSRPNSPTTPKPKTTVITNEFKSWFCFSGQCKNNKCTDGPRKLVPFKAHEITKSQEAQIQPGLSAAMLLAMGVMAAFA